MSNGFTYVVLFSDSKPDNVDTKANRFEAMEAKRYYLLLVVICLVVSSPTRAVDMDERGAAQVMRVIEQMRAYFKLGSDASMDEVVKYALSKVKEMKKRKNGKTISSTELHIRL